MHFKGWSNISAPTAGLLIFGFAVFIFGNSPGLYNMTDQVELRRLEADVGMGASDLPQVLPPDMITRPSVGVYDVKLNNEPYITVCACAKCGSTSLYHELYNRVHGKGWTYGGAPYIHDLRSERWSQNSVRAMEKCKWSGKSSVKYWKGKNECQWRDDDHSRDNSLALIRDPKERLVSAWKSKVMCDEGGDVADRAYMVPGLLRLAGVTAEESSIIAKKPANGGEGLCLDLDDFIQVMFRIHAQGKQGMINDHFRPQHLGCFLQVPPENWKVVTTAKSPDIMCKLESLLPGGNGNADDSNSDTMTKDCGAMKKTHATESLSHYHHANLTAVDIAMLDAITQDEYKVLGPYLD